MNEEGVVNQCSSLSPSSVVDQQNWETRDSRQGHTLEWRRMRQRDAARTTKAGDGDAYCKLLKIYRPELERQYGQQRSEWERHDLKHNDDSVTYESSWNLR